MTGPDDIAFDAEQSADTANTGSELNNVGVLLRADRLRRGQDLIEVSKTLRIQFSYLSAIEQGKYEDLPKGPYALGFVRTYADYLGLDADEIVRRFKQEFQEATTRSDLVFPTPEQETSIPSGAVVVVSVGLALAAYGGWYYTQTQDRSVVDLVEPVPERLVELTNDENRAAPLPQVSAQPLQGFANPVAEEPTSALEASAAENLAVTPIEAVLPEVEEIAGPEEDAELEEVSEEVALPVVDDEPVVDIAEVAVEPVEESVDLQEETAEAPTIDVTTIDNEVADPVSEPEVLDTVAVAPEEVEVPVVEAQIDVVTEDVTVELAEVAPEENAIDTVAAELAAIPAAPEVEALLAPDVPRESSAEAAANAANAASSRIVIRATDRSWVRVLGADDKVLLTRMLMPGDVYEAPNEPELSLEAGNAGALEIEVDGTKLPPIGGFGEVVANYPLKPDELLAEIQ